MKNMFLVGFVLAALFVSFTSDALAQAEKGWIGIEAQPASKELLKLFDIKSGIIVTKVADKSPAGEMNFQTGDMIIHVDGKVISFADFTTKINNLKVGDTITFTLFNKGDSTLTAIKKPDVFEQFLRDKFDKAPLDKEKHFGNPLTKEYWDEKFSDWMNDLLTDPNNLLDFKNWAKEQAGDVLADLLELVKKKIEQLQDDKNLLDKLFKWAQNSFSANEVQPLPRFGKIYLGIQASDPTEHMLNTNQLGVVVEKVLPGTPAERAGIEAGDRIFRFGEFTIRNKNDLKEALGKTELNVEVEIRVARYFRGKVVVRSFRIITEEK